MTVGIAVDEVFGALADPTRRDLLEELAERGEASASARPGPAELPTQPPERPKGPPTKRPGLPKLP